MTRNSEELLDVIWRSLQEATTRRTPFTLGYLGTVGAEGEPRVRAVILRRFEQDRHRIMFATNSRSAKVDELRNDPRVALTVNDDARAVQLRMEGTASVVDDADERSRAWETFAPHSRALYRSPLVPGTPMEAEDESDDETPAFEHFAWVSIDLRQLDWLDLSNARHERWRFVRDSGVWTGQRVVP